MPPAHGTARLSSARELLFCVLLEELLHEHRKCRRDFGGNRTPTFGELILLFLRDVARPLGDFRFALGSEAEFPDRERVARSSRWLKLVIPEYGSGVVFAFIYRHQFNTITSVPV